MVKQDTEATRRRSIRFIKAVSAFWLIPGPALQTFPQLLKRGPHMRFAIRGDANFVKICAFTGVLKRIFHQGKTRFLFHAHAYSPDRQVFPELVSWPSLPPSAKGWLFTEKGQCPFSSGAAGLVASRARCSMALRLSSFGGGALNLEIWVW